MNVINLSVFSLSLCVDCHDKFLNSGNRKKCFFLFILMMFFGPQAFKINHRTTVKYF